MMSGKEQVRRIVEVDLYDMQTVGFVDILKMLNFRVRGALEMALMLDALTASEFAELLADVNAIYRERRDALRRCKK